eukprot:662444-Rhodomonas_salina.1
MAMISPLIRVSPKIAFVSDDSVLVKEPIEKRGEELLRAPENCALIAEIETSLADAQVTLALELLKNRELLEDASLLPSEVDLLHKWSDAELAELQWAPLAAKARADRTWLHAAFASSSSSFSFEEFSSAVDVVRCHAK